jgi:tight adherence protein B
LHYYEVSAIVVALLLGIARSAIFVAERQRNTLRARLRGLLVAADTDAEPNSLTIRRPLIKGRLRGSYLLPPTFLARLEAALAATGDSIGVSHLIVTSIVATVATVAFELTATQLPVSLVITSGAAAAVASPVILLRLWQGRYQRRFLHVFPDALDLIVRAVRAGLPALDAIDLSASETASPVGTEFRRMLDEMRVGIGMESALQHAADRIRVQDFRFFVVCLVLQRRTGGALAETLSNLSTVIRHRRAVRLKARALTAETKASAAVIATMPLIASAGFFFISPQMMSSLFVDPRGRFMLTVAILFLLLGISLMIVIIRKGPQ